jgi:hypothetical protein
MKKEIINWYIKNIIFFYGIEESIKYIVWGEVVLKL